MSDPPTTPTAAVADSPAVSPAHIESPRPTGPGLPRGAFWILLVVLLVPASAFIVASYLQLASVLQHVNATPASSVAPLLNDPRPLSEGQRAAVSLEHDIMLHRHQRTTAFIATRTWMRFMSLMFGALMVTIGAAFVLGRVSGPAYEAGANRGDWSASLKSTSPGLFLVAAGIVLIAIPNLSTQPIETNDTSTYFVPVLANPIPLPAGGTELTPEEHALLLQIQQQHPHQP